MAVDRGAEQGDPLGSIQCGLVLALVMERVRSRLLAERGREGVFADAWFMDDGQIFCKPELVDDLLRILDEELEKVGATKCSDENVNVLPSWLGRRAQWPFSVMGGSQSASATLASLKATTLPRMSLESTSAWPLRGMSSSKPLLPQ